MWSGVNVEEGGIESGLVLDSGLMPAAFFFILFFDAGAGAGLGAWGCE